MEKLKVLLFLICTALLCGAGENLVMNGDAAGGIVPIKGLEIRENGPGGVKCFVVTKGKRSLEGVDFIQVDPNATYELTVELCGDAVNRGNNIDFGLAPYDENKRRVTHSSLDFVPGTEAVLAEAVAKGAKTMKFRGAGDWTAAVKKGGKIIAMNAKEDFSDLPNTTLSYFIRKVTKEGDITTVELSHPVQRAYPEGTPVRLHKDGGFQWSVLEFKQVPGVWKTYKARISGMSTRGVPYNQFWKGTKYVRLVLSTRKDHDLFLNKISMTMVEDVPEGKIATSKTLIPDSDSTIITTPVMAWPRRRFAQKDNGVIVIEAEAPWSFVPSKLDISTICNENGCGGGRYMQHMKNSVYPISVKKAGKYQIFYRQRIPFAAEWNHTMTLDGKSIRVFDCKPETFVKFSNWNWNGTNVVELAEGEHSFAIDFQGGPALDQIAIVPADGQHAPKGNEVLEPLYAEQGLSGEAIYRGFMAGPRFTDAVLSYKISGKGNVAVTASLDGGSTWSKYSSGDKLPDCAKETPLLVKVAMSSTKGEDISIIEDVKVDYLVSTELPADKSRIEKGMETSCGIVALQPAKWTGVRWGEDNALHFSNPLVQNRDGKIFARITDADNTVLAPPERSWFEKDESLKGATVLHQGRLNSNLLAFDFNVKETGKYRPYFLMRMTLPSTAITMEFNRPEHAYLKFGYSIDNKKVNVDGIGTGAPSHKGAYYRGEYYWCGGNPVELFAGEHCLRLLWGMHYMNCAAVAIVPEGAKPQAPEFKGMPATSARKGSNEAVVEYARINGRLQGVDVADTKLKYRFEISFDDGKTFVPMAPMRESRDFVLKGYFTGKGAIPRVNARLKATETVQLKDRDQRIVFDKVTGNLTGYFLNNGMSLLPEGSSHPLFSFQIGSRKKGFRLITPEIGTMVERRAYSEKNSQILEMKYELCDNAVTVVLKVTVEDGKLPMWEISLDNRSGDDIRHVEYPIFRDVRLCNEPENGYYTAVRNLCAFGWPGAALGGRDMQKGTWPGSYSMGYSAIYAKGVGSFTMQNRNPDGIGVYFSQGPNAGRSALCMSTSRRYTVEAGKKAAFKYAAGYYNGTEHDVCELYGKWAHTWMDFSYVNQPLAKNVTACAHQSYYPPERTENQMIPIYRWMGYEMHWHVLGRVSYTHLYSPNYGKPEVVAAAHRALEAAGQPVIQYWDHYGWPFAFENSPEIAGYKRNQIPFIETLAKPGFAEIAGNRSEFGRFCPWGYAPPDCTMCNSSKEWQDYSSFVMNDHYMMKYGLSGIYHDETCVYVECYNDKHAHGKQYGTKMIGLGKTLADFHDKAKKDGRLSIVNGEGSPDYLLQFQEMGLRSGPDALDGAPLLFAFPEIKFFRGEANHPIDGVPNWDEAVREYHLHARSDVPIYAGNSRHFIMHRARIRDWMYNGVFRDNVGLTPSEVGVMAKYFIRKDRDYYGIIVNIRNEHSKAGVKLNFDRSILEEGTVLPVNALAYLMESERVEPVSIENKGDAFSVAVPADRASSILIQIRAPRKEMVRADVIWPQEGGEDVLRISVMNFGDDKVKVPLKLKLPEGISVSGMPESVTLRGGEYFGMDVPMAGRQKLQKLEEAVLTVNGMERTTMLLPNILNGSFEKHTGKTMAADYWGVSPTYYVHAFRQVDDSKLDMDALGGILDENKPYEGRYSLRIPGHSVPLPFPKTLSGPYGRFNYPNKTTLLPWYYNAQQDMILKPGTRYRLTFACRFAGDDGQLKLQAFPYTERLGQVSFIFKARVLKPASGDREWRQQVVEFTTPDKIFNSTQVPVSFVNIGKSDVWVDAVSVVEVK